MSLIVQKFGGSSVRDYAHLLRMARIVKSRVDEGDDVVVVLSAQGDTTDGLLQKAKKISERPSPRELDMLLSAGEQMSAALGAMTLRSIGVEAVSLCAWQIPIETDGTHGNAEIELIDTARIRKELPRTTLWSRRAFRASTSGATSRRSDAAARTRVQWRSPRR